MLHLTPDPDPMSKLYPERCCFCRKHTRLWYTPKDVAVCEDCGKTHTPEEVPSKKEWFEKERALEKQTRPWE